MCNVVALTESGAQVKQDALPRNFGQALELYCNDLPQEEDEAS